jgi:hypothetical protein
VVHSQYRRVSHFIRQVISSFATEAPANCHLVFKHHPLDRGFRNHGPLIRKLAEQHGVVNRVHYVHDLHLPTLLQHALGTVVINSTVGLSSLVHGTPVKTTGKAVYDLPGLTHQGPLSSFWHNPEPIDQRLHRNFRRYLIAQTQINGSFYSWRGFQQGREYRFAAAFGAPAMPAGTGRDGDNLGIAATDKAPAAQPSTIMVKGTNQSWVPETPVSQSTASNSSRPRMTTHS